jgi:hypothetical protein
MARKKSSRHNAGNLPKLNGALPTREIKLTLSPFADAESDMISITEYGPDGEPLKVEKKGLDDEQRLYMVFLQKCLKSGYDLNEALLQIARSLETIFQKGYIPSEDECYELTPQQYAKYYAAEGYTKERIFLLLPKNPMYQSTDPRELEVLSEDETTWFGKAEKVIECYCRDYGKTFATLEEKLTWMTTVLPPAFSNGTRFRRNLLHEVK